MPLLSQTPTKRRPATAAVLCGLVLSVALSGRTAHSQSSRTFKAVQEVRISGENENLIQILWLQVFSDGTMAVNQERDQAIRLFSADGKAIKTVGRAGRGPGEFQSLRIAGLLGDTLWIYDDIASRLSFLAKPFASLTNRAVKWGLTTPIQLLPGGEAIAQAGPTWSRIGASGAVMGTISIRPTVKPAEGLLPFNAVVRWAYAPTGSWAMVARTEFVKRGQGRIRVVGIGLPAGDTLFRAQVPFETEAIPTRARDSAKADRVGRARTPTQREEFNAMVVPEFYPPIRDVYADGDGRTWLGLRTSTPERRWAVVDAKGSVIGTLNLPRDAVVKFARGDRV